ncbi:hypothetical protein MAR_011998 [Mya arenaria]|uniref:Uncharacterized protein n=1 Tax=Mya arenaria TaxID=6604 RepID=A0ABY7FYB4_MYAAR|nr:hypothetical protein MAR_011998 [Mya arenaria]
MTVGDGCSLYLGSAGTTTRTGLDANPGTFDMETLTVAAGGEITATPDLTGADNEINIQANTMRVAGGGIVHAVHVNIGAQQLIVDDLGEIIGDFHSVSCSTGNGVTGTSGSGAGHGGRGGGVTSNPSTGAPYGQLVQPVDRGCQGGSSTVSGTGGRGGGVIYIRADDYLQNDGEISCNGEAGTGAGGGGSGGSIQMDINNIKGYGEFQVIGGDGSKYSSFQGCGGSGGRIAMYFDRNFTFSGTWDVYGGDAPAPECDGASGTAFFYHNVTNTFTFDEVQIFGNAHLAILTDTVGDAATIYFENMIGDRTGAVHVGAGQTLDLQRPKIDLPFNVHVYPDGFLGLAPDTYVQDIDIFLNGTLAYIKNLTIHHDGNLWLYQEGKTNGEEAGSYNFDFVHVKTDGYIHMVTDPVTDHGINFKTIDTQIDGGGLIRGTHLYFHSQNITVHSGGSLNADYLGYRVTDTSGTGVYGQINPGLGHNGTLSSSGGGHGGSGGRGEGETIGGSPYGDLYEPTMFGSAGGGDGGGRGGGRIWLNVTDTLHIDGSVTANGDEGKTVFGNLAGGGSGGSIWIHTDTITGFGLIQTGGGQGSSGGGGGGRFAMYFHKNTTFTEFRYLANGGWPGTACGGCEAGGPGTAFLYHMVEKHRTLIIDNDDAPLPTNKYVNWDNINEDGCRAWILPISGVHAFAAGTSGSYAYEFEELQIYGNGHLAVMPPSVDNVDNGNDDNTELEGVNKGDYSVIIFFKYMIGDRTGAVHVADGQALDLLSNMQREEMDLPFNTYTYYGSYLGLAPVTFIHAVEIHLAGYLANVHNITLRLGGYLWLKHGGHTTEKPESSYMFDYIKIQDDSVLNATTDQISEKGITFYLDGLTIEGGGVMHGTYITVNAQNVTIDAGGHLSANGRGYTFEHSQDIHGSSSVHGVVNPGAPDAVNGIGGGGGHGGSGGKEAGDTSRAGFAYGDIYEPQKMGSSGGAGENNAPGGSGGGRLWFNVTDTIFIDGLVSANGAVGVNDSGGGSGGSIWMHCNIIKGYGKIVAHGGDGSNYVNGTGSGGAGGRISVNFNVNKTMSEFRYLAYGGAKGGPLSENGGPGTAYVYHKLEEHRTIIMDNNGQHPRDEHNVIVDYADLTYDSSRAWILPESGYNDFANGKFEFHFEEIQMYGAAHLAILPEPIGTEVDVFFRNMIGDRTGTVHLGDNQVMDLERLEIDLPFNCRVYEGAFLGLAPVTIMHGITVWLHGEMDHVENLTLHHDGQLSLETGGFTSGNSPDVFDFLWVRIQDNATISILVDPVSDPQSLFRVANKISMEGGSTFVVTNTKITAKDMILDYGASLHADSTGYRADDPQTTTVNVGVGTASTSGSSGAGYGGSSGKGGGTSMTGQPYGHLFQPYHLGSAGGGGLNSGGQGGGKIVIEVSDMLMIDGEIRVNGGDGRNITGGGGSGGTLQIDTYNFRGMGNITANGGGRFAAGTGGGGAGGRIALYFRQNVTYWGGFQCHGGYSAGSAEPGGPGPVFIYNVAKEHSTLYINNNGLQTPTEVNLIRDYTDISQDRFKAWVMPESSDHRLAGSQSDYSFDELQIFGNAHLALLPEPYTGGCNLHFIHMIGDRTGFIHIGPYQVMDLNRPFLDTPFSSYVYDGGYLGLAPDTFMEKVFAHIEGTVDHIHNLTLVQGGGLRLFKSGSTNDLSPLTYKILGLTVIKAESYINCSNPNADSDAYQLTFGWMIVEGGGLLKGGNLHIKATDFFLDDGGSVDVSDGGYRPDNGPGVGIGTSGGSHGGLGGRGGCDGYTTCRLHRNMPYGDLYIPVAHGSGGGQTNGGTGGGVLHMEVAHTLAVDGYIKANSYDTGSNTGGASGGSAGSIYIQTHNFTGSHTGHIQALGGSGDLVNGGGGGSGGRIALYHQRHETIPLYRGYFDVYGGAPGTHGEAGSSGTAYVNDDERNYNMLKVDNNGQQQISEDTAVWNEGYRLDLSSYSSSYSKTTSYTTTDGHTVSSSASIYDCSCYVGVCNCPYTNAPTYYRLHHLFDQTLHSHGDDYYMAEAGSATVTVTLATATYINKVVGYDESNTAFDVTPNFIVPSSSPIQGSYIDLPVGKIASKFEFLLSGNGNQYSYVALNEIEIFAEESPEHSRYKYISLHAASTWILADAGQSFDFSEIYIQGQAHLSFRPKNSYTDAVSVFAGNVVGDKTGYFHIGYNQEMVVNATDYDVPFNTHVYEKGHITYPPRNFFYKTKLFSSGKVSGIEDLYVFKEGRVSIDSNGSLATSHAPATVSLKSLHVQEGGTFQLFSDSPDTPFVIDATNISIYGGGHFSINTGLNMTVHHLLAVYSGGKIDLSGAGYQPNSGKEGTGAGIGSTSGGSGGGHGGSGGRGSGLGRVGTGYDSLYNPAGHGSAGDLYYGDHPHGNKMIYKTLGGAGGGYLVIESRHVDIDGLVAANGNAPDTRFDRGSGGGSGGSIWIVCDEIVGHGTITAYGGDGGGPAGAAGGGGAGGRISVQCDNILKFNISMKSYGGVSNSETGGAGTSYLESKFDNGTLDYQKMTIDNNGHAYPHAAIYAEGDMRNLLNGEYVDISYSGGVTWLFHGALLYRFKQLDVRGNAHVAILSDTDNEQIDVRVEFLWGDRTGVLHAGKNQTFGLTDVDTYLPANLASYRGSRIEVPNKVIIREVWAEINGTIEGMDVITVENRGELYIWSHANSDGYEKGEIKATNISVRAGGKFEPLAAVRKMKLYVTRLVINGNGYVRTNNLQLNATNVTIDLSGEFHADFTGYPGGEGPGAGRNIHVNESGGSGGGHGGRGGRGKSGYYSAFAYDSIYNPSEIGSGGGNPPQGGGGRGGGIIYMYIEDELRVEGRLHSNGEVGSNNQAGGGAGGSLYLNVNHLDGTGFIETTGGDGGTNGGGGGGGRIAIYHTIENHFTGEYLIYGGKGPYQFGGAGTVYIEDNSVSPAYRHLRTDNGGRTESNRIYEVERLNLTGKYFSTKGWPDTYFQTYSGINVTSDVRPGTYYAYQSSSYGYLYHTVWPLSHMFSDKKANVDKWFMAQGQEATLTFDLPFKTYVEYIMIYPYCNTNYAKTAPKAQDWGSLVTYYAASTSLEGGASMNRTDGFMTTDYCQTQTEEGQYGIVEIKDNVDQIIVSLKATGSYVALSEVEIYIREDPTATSQTPYSIENGTSYIMPEGDVKDFEFDKLDILGGASLNLDGEDMTLTAHVIEGDDTGRVTARRTQQYENTQARVLQTIGHFRSMENITVNARCNLTIDHHEQTTNIIDSLDIKTFGSVNVFTEDEVLTTLQGTSLTVRSGARLTSNDLKLDYFNVTIEPYGVGAGHGNVGGSSGGGHGGNGGGGQAEAYAGGAHDSFLYPTKFGNNGGHALFPHRAGVGGGRLYLRVNHTLTVDGFLVALGGNWRSVGSGGGSGGSIHIETYTIDGSGEIDASGGTGYSGSWAPHGGGGGGGRVALYYMYNFYVGDFINHGGAGGSQSEAGGPGTVYIHHLPDMVDGQPPAGFVDNRTLYLNNKGYEPKDPYRNLTDTYPDYPAASGVAWIWPGEYPPLVNVFSTSVDPESDITLEYIKLYEKAQVAMVRPTYTDLVDVQVGYTEGDRTGHLHIGYNQKLFIGTGQLPMHVSLYHGSTTTLQGELRVAGVNVMIEGMVAGVENMTIVDGGTLKVNYMMDLNFQRIDDIRFTAFSIRNRGSMVFPGGSFEAKHLYVEVTSLYVDVMGTFRADGTGFCDMEGPGAGTTYMGDGQEYGTGASHGGEAGAGNSSMVTPSAYGNFIYPDQFGSAGGDGGSTKGGCGGGILILNASSILKVDGVLSANGDDGGSTAGGGAGGSIYIVTDDFDGAGSIEVKGGSGYNGGAGGRMSTKYGYSNFIGSFFSDGGEASGGENGAAGTVFTKDTSTDGKKTLKVYNREGEGNRRTRISIPESKTEDHDIDTLDLGDYAQVGLLATDNEGKPTIGRRDLYLQLVEGDYTATIHVEEGMFLNIDFQNSAVLSFSIAVYPDSQVNLPSDTYLKDVTVSDYGGTILGLETFNISRGGAVHVYPPEASNPHFKEIVYDLNTISILDGGSFTYHGTAENNDVLTVNLAGDLMIRGGGVMTVNKMILNAINITVESEGILSASSGGFLPGGGDGAGVGSADGSSGGSHGGLGGMGSDTAYAGLAHGSTHTPKAYGSGGGTAESATIGRGGGVLEMVATGFTEVDGTIRADGEDATGKATGGGAGGSVYLRTGHYAGTGLMSARGGAGSCVPGCTKCDSERRCLQCLGGYTWDAYVCKNAYYSTAVAGGGGGGGRIAVWIDNSTNDFRGDFQTYGGKGFTESGGSGTVYVNANNDEGVVEATLTIDNRNSVPNNVYIDDKLEDSCRTYVITSSDDDADDMTFDHVYVNGDGHLAFRKTSSDSVDVTINNLHGDLSGMVHTSVDQKVQIVDSDSPIPASFRVYDTATIQLPAELYFKDLKYTDIYIDGQIDGVQNLSLGQGVNFVIGENGFTSGYEKLTFAFENVEVFADGKISSPSVEEFSPSLILEVANEIRLHAGAVIEAPWVKIDATGGTIQIDAASKINASYSAPQTLDQDGVSTLAGGGSGGGSGAAGGQGSFQNYVGPPPDYGSLYEPTQYGGNGGDGGGSSSDLRCTFSPKQSGGKGGGVIELAADNFLFDGELRVSGGDALGPRGGGGAGGSVFVNVLTLSGDGIIYAQGGSIGDSFDPSAVVAATPASPTAAPLNGSDSNCQGGGGAGGRVALRFNDDSAFSGTVKAYGGRGYECGGAGTYLRVDVDDDVKKLFVDNENVCTPLDARVDWEKLTETHKGQLSFHTWLFDEGDDHEHVFDEVTLSGQAQLALYRITEQAYTQTVTVKKSIGDKTGVWHVGPYQQISTSLPADSPELQFGIFVYDLGTMLAEQTLTVKGITIENEGALSGVEHLVIGPNGVIILRPDTSASVPEISFISVTVKGGGTLKIETEGRGMKLVGTDFTVESGGRVEADNLVVSANSLTVEDSAYISADEQAVHEDGGLGKGEGGRGAGHGGQGGQSTNTTASYGGGLYYGDVVAPIEPGSNGIYTDMITTEESIGGGVLKFDITDTAYVDGIISCNGQKGSSTVGGASGGSIILNTVNFNGKGKITANGGAGAL